MYYITKEKGVNTMRYEEETERCRCEEEVQRHVHEFLGSTRVVEYGDDDDHNHRFAGVTGDAIECRDNNGGVSHNHRIVTRTDNYNDHYHVIDVMTGPAIPVGNGLRHIHYVFACTRDSNGHKHNFRVATLIENPIGDSEYC